ncbi:MAG: peptide chain release factor 2 [Propionibacterium sp.]|uniref:Peptide chain release factor 2 n=1 Tax=Brooklawnia propionicigenes TaxID=3041175 RepID=A0AAN0K7Y5_9ACTN|nr:peptide chain release factor 2 [Brooklawnia sp. SH051]MEA5121264.1 peptide chain release factor 2 [Propionibacterium sp.]NLI85646.1 peptide chain release factor 2 [Propionibacterium sp.]BEH03407.1 peptide chain release factor 2 [Brooklawnia sp. SH051]
MAVADLPDIIHELDRSLTSIEVVVDPDSKKVEIAKLEEESAAPDLWNDQANAQRVTSRLSRLQSEVERVEDLRQRLDDVQVLLELAAEEGDRDSAAEAEHEVSVLKGEIEALEVRTLLGGEYDERDALVTIRSEAGGVDAADFAAMLLRMYERWAERHGYPIEVYDVSYAEEAGIKSATFTVKSPYAYGTLSVEQGTHRLVRISPFDNQGRRQTSFAGVEVLPVVEETDHIDVPETDIRVDVFRSSGPGGQSVNTTDSAVRITHLPTGLVVSCQNEKSQIQNKAAALRVLQARLLEKARQDREAEMNALKSAGNSWGSQMRSYVLHPYQMVKDLRTNYETGNTDAVFDGDIDAFIDAGIRWRQRDDAA